MTDMHARHGSAWRNDTIRTAKWPTRMFWIWVLVVLALIASFFWTGIQLPYWPW